MGILLEECREEGDPLWQWAAMATGKGRLWGATAPSAWPAPLSAGNTAPRARPDRKRLPSSSGFCCLKSQALGGSEGAPSVFHGEPSSRSALAVLRPPPPSLAVATSDPKQSSAGVAPRPGVYDKMWPKSNGHTWSYSLFSNDQMTFVTFTPKSFFPNDSVPVVWALECPGKEGKPGRAEGERLWSNHSKGLS